MTVWDAAWTLLTDAAGSRAEKYSGIVRNPQGLQIGDGNSQQNSWTYINTQVVQAPTGPTGSDQPAPGHKSRSGGSAPTGERNGRLVAEAYKAIAADIHCFDSTRMQAAEKASRLSAEVGAEAIRAAANRL
jgi:hypothetical protein